jgi:hypothetical protein
MGLLIAGLLRRLRSFFFLVIQPVSLSTGDQTNSAPVSCFFGLGRSPAAKAHVVQPIGLCPQIDFDIAQGLPVGQLRKRHGKELVQAREVFALVVVTMLGHAPAKSAHGQIGHELRKHKLALVRTGLSRSCAKGHKSDPRLSNRDQTEVPNSASKLLTYEALA